MVSDLDILRMFKEVLRFMAVVLVVVSGLLGCWYLLKIQSEAQVHQSQPPQVVAEALVKSPFLAPSQGSTTARHLETVFQNQQWFLTGSPEQSLVAALENFDSEFVFLNILDDDPLGLKLLKSQLEERNLWQRLIVFSRSDKLLKDLRELAPRWAYSTGEVFLARYLSFSSLGLSGLLELPGDAIYVSNRRKLHEDEREKILKFAKDRGTIVIFDTENSGSRQESQAVYLIP